MNKAIDLELFPLIILGFEEDGSGDSEDSSDDQDQNDDGAGSSDSEEENDDESEDDSEAGLKSALRAERLAARTANKELKEAQRKLKQADKREADRLLAEKSEIEQAQARELESKTKIEKLSAGLLQRTLKSAIVEAATQLRFADPQDAVSMVDRDSIVFSQDEDDPSEIEIDQKTVVAAVKALASKKPHFLKSGTEDGEPTGGQFGGAKKKKKTSDDQFKDKYPSLR